MASFSATGTLSGGKTSVGLDAAADLGLSGNSETFPYRHFGAGGRLTVKTKYNIRLFDSNGRLKWTDEFENLVTTAGLNKLLDATFKTGLASPAWYIGLVDGAGTPVYAASDTMAAHSGWTENQDYSEATRQSFTPGSVANASVDNISADAAFTITQDGTIAGCFMADESTKGGSTETLYGAGGFAGGSKAETTGDILHARVTISIAAA